jgi:hypothetical protein
MSLWPQTNFDGRMKPKKGLTLATIAIDKIAWIQRDTGFQQSLEKEIVSG